MDSITERTGLEVCIIVKYIAQGMKVRDPGIFEDRLIVWRVYK